MTIQMTVKLGKRSRTRKRRLKEIDSQRKDQLISCFFVENQHLSNWLRSTLGRELLSSLTKN
jgi:hypothetical protein